MKYMKKNIFGSIKIKEQMETEWLIQCQTPSPCGRYVGTLILLLFFVARKIYVTKALNKYAHETVAVQ